MTSTARAFSTVGDVRYQYPPTRPLLSIGRNPSPTDRRTRSAIRLLARGIPEGSSDNKTQWYTRCCDYVGRVRFSSRTTEAGGSARSLGALSSQTQQHSTPSSTYRRASIPIRERVESFLPDRRSTDADDAEPRGRVRSVRSSVAVEGERTYSTSPRVTISTPSPDRFPPLRFDRESSTSALRSDLAVPAPSDTRPSISDLGGPRTSYGRVRSSRWARRGLHAGIRRRGSNRTVPSTRRAKSYAKSRRGSTSDGGESLIAPKRAPRRPYRSLTVS